MIVVNTETIPGKMIVELKGLVQGNTVRAKHFGRDLAASFKNLVGGELKGYTELLVEARREAVARMIAQAEELQANAIVNVRFATSSITAGAAELYAYGTAVVVVDCLAAAPNAIMVQPPISDSNSLSDSAPASDTNPNEDMMNGQ